MASYWNDPNAGKEMWYDRLVWWHWILICLGSLLGLIFLCCLWELFWTKICGCGDVPPSRGNSATSRDDENEVTEITDTDKIGAVDIPNHNFQKSSCGLMFLGFRPFNRKIFVESID